MALLKLKSFTKTVKGAHGSWQLKVDNSQLQRMFNAFEKDAPKVLKKVIRELAEEHVHKERWILKGEATKKGWPWQGSAYQKIADNIKVNSRGGKEPHISVFTAPYPSGPIGSRGVKLAALHIGGKGPFPYGLEDTGKRISSSAKWARKRGQYDFAWGFIKGKMHPGFKPQPYPDRILKRMSEGFDAKVEQEFRKHWGYIR